MEQYYISTRFPLNICSRCSVNIVRSSDPKLLVFRIKKLRSRFAQLCDRCDTGKLTIHRDRLWTPQHTQLIEQLIELPKDILMMIEKYATPDQKTISECLKRNNY